MDNLFLYDDYATIGGRGVILWVMALHNCRGRKRSFLPLHGTSAFFSYFAFTKKVGRIDMIGVALEEQEETYRCRSVDKEGELCVLN